MAYQVLARKWRPRAFKEMVGQTHVQRVLINALEQDRLHHAYLFTGTRGVGKTTIARIFAKSVNCEQGISAEPCNQCSTCKEVDAGRYVDLIEVDAASRTKVEDTRELLENVQYAPSRGRFKVYLIDEVHMLSVSSFNALLKTLEEPPPHIKFLFATTDPQKLPATILSRCLQFNLKRLSPQQIQEHLLFILEQEKVEFEPVALRLLAKAADGSMRDALSLLDQAIAYGGGKLSQADVSSMLGTLDHGAVSKLIQALAAQDGAMLLAQVAHMAEHNPDYQQLLAELLSLLQQLAIAQLVPSALDENHEDFELLQQLAQQLSPEDVQLFYQIGVQGNKDLPFAPDLRGGLEMILLRMLAFRPAAQGNLDVVASTVVPSLTAPAQQSTQKPAAKPSSSASPAIDAKDPFAAARAALGKTLGDLKKKKPEPKAEVKAETLPVSPLTPPVKPAEPEPVLHHSEPAPALSPMAAAQAATATPPVADTLEPTPAAPNTAADEPKPAAEPVAIAASEPEAKAEEAVPAETETSKAEAAQAIAETEESTSADEDDLPDWASLIDEMRLGGMLKVLAENCSLQGRKGSRLLLSLPPAYSSLSSPDRIRDLEKKVSKLLDESVTLDVRVEQTDTATPADLNKQKKSAQHQAAITAIEEDQHVLALQDLFGASIDKASIKAL